MRAAALLLLLATAAPAAAPEPEFVQAVEFPYYLYPRTLWERELVWMKTIGVRTVAFSIPWNWHQPAAGDFDFTGRTSPRRDLVSFIRILRKLELRGWVRPLGGGGRAGLGRQCTLGMAGRIHRRCIRNADGSHLNKLGYPTTLHFLVSLQDHPKPCRGKPWNTHSRPSVSDATLCQTVWSWPR